MIKTFCDACDSEVAGGLVPVLPGELRVSPLGASTGEIDPVPARTQAAHQVRRAALAAAETKDGHLCSRCLAITLRSIADRLDQRADRDPEASR